MCSWDVIRQAADAAQGRETSGKAGEEDGSHALLGPDALAACRHVQDLTHITTAEFPVFPGDRQFEARPVRLLERHGYALHELRLSEHTGTHLDAPAHFFAGGATAEHLSLSSLISPLVVISIAERAAKDHDTSVCLDDVLAWERQHGSIPAGAVVAMYSGWEDRLRDPATYLNQDAAGVMHSPGFGSEAAEFLVHEREIAAVATDTLSLDVGASTAYEAHRVVLGAGMYGLENVAKLNCIPPAGATLVVGGPKHRGATGGPARLLAFY